MVKFPKENGGRAFFETVEDFIAECNKQLSKITRNKFKVTVKVFNKEHPLVFRERDSVYFFVKGHMELHEKHRFYNVFQGLRSIYHLSYWSPKKEEYEVYLNDNLDLLNPENIGLPVIEAMTSSHRLKIKHKKTGGVFIISEIRFNGVGGIYLLKVHSNKHCNDSFTITKDDAENYVFCSNLEDRPRKRGYLAIKH